MHPDRRGRGAQLGTGWKAAPADNDLRRAFTAPDFDDRGWDDVQVPGRWAAGEDGPMLYRVRFDTPSGMAATDTRSWVTFNGVMYDGDVWLDGAYLGSTEGYFVPHTFEIPEGGDHTLAVEVGGARPGALVGEDDRRAGIWLPVEVSTTGPVRVTRLRLVCTEATSERARLDIRTVLDSDSARDVTLRVVVRDPNRGPTAELSESHLLAHGENRIRLRLSLAEPDLWWPRALGDQPLYEVDVDVLVGDDVSDTVRSRTGLRQIRMTNWITTVNGERIFLKGATVHADDDGWTSDLDLVRLHTHVRSPAFYEDADRAGLLVWQDLPFHGRYARTIRRQALRQAREAVDLLAYHPSVALWCTTDVFDLSVGRALERADPSRPVIRPPGSPLRLAGDAARLFARWPRGARWVADVEPRDPETVRAAIETVRRLKYRPAGGYGIASGSEGSEAVIVVADHPASGYVAGEPIRLDVHVVSDLRRPLHNARVLATLGAHRWGWEGDIPADACVKVGTIHTPAVAGALELVLTADGVVAKNAYPIAVTPP